MRNGLTPVVAVAILAGMAVVAAGGAYTWIQMVQQDSLDQASRQVDTELTVKDITCSDTTVDLAIKNSGGKDITATAADVYLYQEGDLLGTVRKDIDGSAMLDAGGFSRLTVPFTTYLEPGTGYHVEVEFDGSDYTLERGCTGETGDLLGYWNFDSIGARTILDAAGEADGTFHGTEMNVSFSGMRHNGTLGGGTGTQATDPAWTTGCERGGCLSFDGTDDYVEATSLNMQGSFTVTAWVRRDGNGGSNPRIVGNRNNFELLEDQGYIDGDSSMSFRVHDGGTHHSYDFPEPIPTGEWTFYAASLNGTHVNRYRGGTLVASSTYGYTPGTTTNPLTIGDRATGSGSSDEWEGRIDDVRIYNRSLSQQEIVSVRDGAAPDTGIAAHYPLDAGSGQTAWNSVFRAPGMHGEAARFDDTRWAETPGTSDLRIDGAVTVEAWVNVRETGGDMDEGYEDVVRKGEDYHLYMIDDSGGRFKWRVQIGGSYDDLVAGPVPTGEWVHVAGVYDPGGGTDNQKLYIDGEVVAQKSTTGSVDTSNAELEIGGRQGLGRINGSIDDVRVYDRALSQQEIQADMNGGEPYSGIVVYYPLDADTGRTGSNAAFWRQGKTGGAAVFDGTDDYVDAGSVDSYTRFTVAAWTNRSDLDGWRPIIGIGDWKTDEIWFGQQNGQSTAFLEYWNDGAGTHRSTATPSGTFPAGSWRHVTGVWNGSRLKIYVNGTLEATSSDLSGSPPMNPAGPVHIGHISGNNRWWNGTIDDLRVYRAALAADRIEAIYNATR